MEHAARTLQAVLSTALVLVATAAAQQTPPTPPSKFPFPLRPSIPLAGDDEAALPIDWPAVVELARGSNLEVQLAQEKIREAHTQVMLAKSQWWPGLRIVADWGHHEGRIQEINGEIIDASKSFLGAGAVASLTFNPQKVAVDVLKARQQVFARSGALDRTSRETVQEASLAYVDLVAAQAGAAIAVEMAELVGELVTRSQEMQKRGVATQQQVYQTRSQHQTQLQVLRKAQQAQLAAGAHLVQLLNLEPGMRLFAADDYLAPVRLVDETADDAELIEQALDQGPGLAEVVAALSALDEQERQLRRIALLPTVSVDIGEGALGGGVGGTHRNYNDYTDVAMSVQWDVMKILGTRHTRDLFESKRRQASLQHQQLRGKLAAGIVVAQEGAKAARQRIELAQSEIRLAIQNYELSDARLRAAEAIAFEVLQAISALGMARRNYLDAVIDYNRSQIQLQFLVGHPEAPPPRMTRQPGERDGDPEILPDNERRPGKRQRFSKHRRPNLPPVGWATLERPAQTRTVAESAEAPAEPNSSTAAKVDATDAKNAPATATTSDRQVR